jgi:large subunit ribosomal protein L15
MFLPNNLISTPGSRHRNKRVGRGNGSNRGTYCGLGNKGQHSRGSGKLRPAFTGEAKQTSFIFGVPKIRGFKSLRPKAKTITLSIINSYFSDGEIVSAQSLFTKGLLDSVSQNFKIVSSGTLEKKVSFDPMIRLSTKVKSQAVLS